jgi:taurine dioxygenase
MAEERAATNGYAHLVVEPITRVIGAEIGGVDIGRPLEPAVLAEIEQAFLDHHVLVFRDQSLSPAQQETFGAHFGSFAAHPFRPSMPGHPGLMRIAKEPHEQGNVGGGWHTDMTFAERPPKGSMLYAVELPPAGLGDTLFSSGEAAYEALSSGMRDLLGRLRAVHCAERIHGVAATAQDNEFRRRAARKPEVKKLTVHPVVRTHPQTGRKSLFVNPSFTMHFDGMSDHESEPLLRFLYQHMAKAEFVARVRWRVGTLVFWDNRCTQHYALNDYHGHRREMRRLMLEGDAPH